MSKKNWFEVDGDGFGQNNAKKDRGRTILELVQNAVDDLMSTVSSYYKALKLFAGDYDGEICEECECAPCECDECDEGDGHHEGQEYHTIGHGEYQDAYGVDQIIRGSVLWAWVGGKVDTTGFVPSPNWEDDEGSEPEIAEFAARIGYSVESGQLSHTERWGEEVLSRTWYGRYEPPGAVAFLRPRLSVVDPIEGVQQYREQPDAMWREIYRKFPDLDTDQIHCSIR